MNPFERETVIRWDQGEKVVYIWSMHKTVWSKMSKMGIKPYKSTTSEGAIVSYSYKMPLKMFRWGLKSARKGSKNPPLAFKKGLLAAGSDT